MTGELGPLDSPTTGGEWGELSKRIPWLRWPYVLVPIVPLVLVLAGAVWAFPAVLARLQAASYRDSLREVQQFTWPAGLQDDPTFSACGLVPAWRCARADVEPRAALTSVAAALAGTGVDLGALRCGDHADPELLRREPTESDCTAVMHANGYSVVAWATRYAKGPGAPKPVELGYTQVTVDLPIDSWRLGEVVGPSSWMSSSLPLPATTAEVPGLPAMLTALPCIAVEGDGCRLFGGTIAIPGSRAADISAAAATFADDLRGGGYRVDTEYCREMASGPRCTVAGRMFRTVGGNGPILTMVVLTANPDGGLTADGRVTT